MPRPIPTASLFYSSPTSINSSGDRSGFELSNTTSGNVARDTAVQINGHIAGKIYNFNFKKMVINCQCSIGAQMGLAASDHPALCSPPSNFIMKEIVQRKAEQCSEQPKSVDDGRKLSKHRPQYLILKSNSNGEKGPACAIFEPECQKNYISARIVRRFDLKSFSDPTADTSMVATGERRITPTRNYVALVTPIGEEPDQSPHRFFVVEHCLQNFDILIGTDIITNLPASATKDEPIGSARPIRSNT